MNMREKMAMAIIERWHPGAMAISLAENGHIIVPPHTLAEAQAAADAALDCLTAPPPTAALKAGEMTLAGYDGAEAITESLDMVASSIYESMTRAMIEDGGK